MLIQLKKKVISFWKGHLLCSEYKTSLTCECLSYVIVIEELSAVAFRIKAGGNDIIARKRLIELHGDSFFKPVSGFDLPRFAGVPTFMRLPHVALDAPKIKDVDIGIIGVPWDSELQTDLEAHGPRQLRDASTMIRAQHPVLGIRPYEKLNWTSVTFQ